MVATVLFKTVDGRCGEPMGVFLDMDTAQTYAEQDVKRLYVSFTKSLNWTRSVDYKRAWEAMVGITGVRYIAQTWDLNPSR